MKLYLSLEVMPNEAQQSPLGFLAAMIFPRESLSALFSSGERALSTVENRRAKVGRYYLDGAQRAIKSKRAIHASRSALKIRALCAEGMNGRQSPERDVAAQIVERRHHGGRKGSTKSSASAGASRNEVVTPKSLRVVAVVYSFNVGCFSLRLASC